jgi:hypothetical protein
VAVLQRELPLGIKDFKAEAGIRTIISMGLPFAESCYQDLLDNLCPQVKHPIFDTSR